MARTRNRPPAPDFSNLGKNAAKTRLQYTTAPTTIETVAATEVSLNPRNPRRELGDLDDLIASINSQGQLQPCLAVTRAAYLRAIPDGTAEIGDAGWVVIAGSRRLAAIKKSQLDTVVLNIQDEMAEDAAKLDAAAIDENTRRRDFTPMEEARAYANFANSYGYGTQSEIARRLARSPGYISQRLTLLKLTPELQTLIDEGTMSLEAGRKIGVLPPEEQKAAWYAWNAPQSTSKDATTKSPEDGQDNTISTEQHDNVSPENIVEPALSQPEKTPPPLTDNAISTAEEDDVQTNLPTATAGPESFYGVKTSAPALESPQQEARWDLVSTETTEAFTNAVEDIHSSIGDEYSKASIMNALVEYAVSHRDDVEAALIDRVK